MTERTLTDAEMQALLDGKSPEEAVDGLAARIEAGDTEAMLLAADLRGYVGALTRAPSHTERREFEQTREMNLARLKRELRARPKSGRAGKLLRFGGSIAVAATIVLALWLPRAGDPATIALADGSAYEMTTLPFSAPPSLRGAADDAEAWDAAGAAYEKGKYERAATLFSEIAAADEDSVDARLYAGIAALASGSAASARELLADADRLAVERDLPRGAVAHYLALAALDEGDEAAARQALEVSIEAGGRYAELSRELLERL